VTLAYRSSDRPIVREVEYAYKALPIAPGDVVLDLGANIGAASRRFIERGARVIAVEADPDNIGLARRNIGTGGVVLWAAVGSTVGRVPFYLRRGKPYLGSTIEDKGRRPVMVPAVTLTGLLKQYRANVIKCDIEFGEYDVPELYALPETIRAIALEVHVRYDLVFDHRRQTDDELRARRREAAFLIDAIGRQGFELLSSRDKRAKDRPIEDDTGLHPLTKSVDAIWAR
jgi:FkbM family methyltransferase